MSTLDAANLLLAATERAIEDGRRDAEAERRKREVEIRLALEWDEDE